MRYCKRERLKDETSTAGRINKARHALNLTQKELCDRSGMKVSTLKNYELGLSVPSSEDLHQFLSLGINPAWIIAGASPMLSEDANPVIHTEQEQHALTQRLLADQLKWLSST